MRKVSVANLVCANSNQAMFFKHETSSNSQEQARCQETPVVIVVVLVFVLVVVLLLLLYIRLWWACLNKSFPKFHCFLFQLAT